MSRHFAVIPMELDHANAYVDQLHRHHGEVAGHKFSLGALFNGVLCGVVIVGRPVSRHRQDGWTLEVTRCDGTANACSFLYRAAWRVVQALGYRRLGTYTLHSESGSSLRGAGFRLIGQVKGRSWHTPSRPRVDRHPTLDKLLWEVP